MAQKATKLLAARNTTTLRRTHLISLSCHTLYLLLRLLIFRSSPPSSSSSSSSSSSFTSTSFLLYLILSTPSFAIEAWLEKIGRPTYNNTSTTTATGDGGGERRSVQKAGEDLEAKGLTEYLWDVLYWTWGCVVLAGVVGDRAWWGWVAVPGYSVYLAVGTYRGVTGGGGGLGGMMGGGGGGGGKGVEGMDGRSGGGESKRQKKMEKRGGGREKVQYR